MIDPKKFIIFLKKNNINYFTGVPDSVLDEFIKQLQNQKTIYHEPTSNEGSAIALGVGYHLATGKIPFVYMQNYGFTSKRKQNLARQSSGTDATLKDGCNIHVYMSL